MRGVPMVVDDRSSVLAVVAKPRSWAIDGTVKVGAPVVQAVGFKLEGSGATTTHHVPSLQACVQLCKGTPCAGVWLHETTCTTYTTLTVVVDVGGADDAVAIVSQGTRCACRGHISHSRL